MYKEDIDISLNDYKFRMDVTVDSDSVNVCIKCISNTCQLSEQCILNVNVKKGSDEAVLTDFYHDILKGGAGTSNVSPKLKGVIYVVLCLLLKQAVQKGILKNSERVVVKNNGHDFSNNLVQSFYQNLGFTPMRGTYTSRVLTLLKTCEKNKDDASKELKLILGNF